MKNKKSSYDKLFIFIAVILLSLNIVIGVILITVSSAVYKSTKLDELQSIGDLFISCMQDNYLVTRDTRSETTKNLHKKFSSKYHLMIYIYDENENLITYDDDATSECAVSFNPRWTGYFIIAIVNNGLIPNPYLLCTN